MVKDSCCREYWQRTEVDVDRHLIVFDKPLSDEYGSISDEDIVNEYVADLSVSSPLSTDKPLWKIHQLMAYRCIIFRLHHSFRDGISLMSMLLVLPEKMTKD
ncbi:O-acyltransferase WSD1-like [Forsythia ovata]|uniref:O-acyltransferase WSD1-like n=1 Tax=Forsythia ovata TaxID=205694 RepID=A0ABD1VJG8_9LAMI